MMAMPKSSKKPKQKHRHVMDKTTLCAWDVVDHSIMPCILEWGPGEICQTREEKMTEKQSQEGS